MDLPDIKKLKSIIALCKKSGVESIEIDNVKITFRESISNKQALKKSYPIVSSELDTSPPKSENELTEEQLLYWSVFNPPEETAKENS